MRESEALRTQARSDLFVAVTRLGSPNCPPDLRAQAVAKYQQCVEKSVKAAVVALREAGILLSLPANKPPTNSNAPKTHEVAKLVTAVMCAPKSARLDPLTQMQNLFRGKVQQAVKMIDAHAPTWPKVAGALHVRNTEYPYETASGQWQPPCDPAAFSQEEVQSAHEIAWRVFHALDKIVAALERAPP